MGTGLDGYHVPLAVGIADGDGILKLRKYLAHIRNVVSSGTSTSALTGYSDCYIIDPSLCDEAGHHLNASTAISAAANSLSYSVVHYVNRAFVTNESNTLHAHPHFATTAYTDLWNIYSRSTLDAKAERRRFVRQLSNTMKRSSSRHRLLVFPTVVHFHLSGIAKVLSSRNATVGYRVLVWLLFDEYFMSTSDHQAAWALNQYADALRELEIQSGNGTTIALVCETEKMKEHFSALTRLPIEVLPLPNVLVGSATDDASMQRAFRAPRVIFAGHVTRDKGYHLLPEIMRVTWRTHPNATFIVHAVVDDPSSEFSQVADELNKLEGPVELISGRLESVAFHNLLRTAEIVLLPYDPVAYKKRGSAIYHEALTLGLPLVLPRQASFAEEALSRGVAVGFDDHTAESIGTALIKAVETLPELANAMSKTSKLRVSYDTRLQSLLGHPEDTQDGDLA